MLKKNIAGIAVGLLATQLMLGCHNEDEESVVNPMKVDVPSDLEKPENLVGNWQEAKGKQALQINADGSFEFINKVTVGAEGNSKGFESKIPGKWGTKSGKFFFTEMKDSPNLVYDWEMKGEKLKLSNSGSELIYTRIIKK